MNCSTPGYPVHHQLPESTQTHVNCVSDAIKSPLLSPSPPALNLSQHQDLFQWVGSSHQVAKYGSFSLNISSSNEYSGLISFRMDWYDFLAVQGTLKSLLQHSLKASVLQCWAFFIVQFSHPYWNQPSHPLSSPSPPAPSPSQHQSLFQWVSSSHQVARVLEFQLQHQSFQWIFRTDFL